jgi:hypothetical protein
MSTLEKVYEVIDTFCAPERMSKEQYKEFLEILIDNLEGRLEGVNDELREE